MLVNDFEPKKNDFNNFKITTKHAHLLLVFIFFISTIAMGWEIELLTFRDKDHDNIIKLSSVWYLLLVIFEFV